MQKTLKFRILGFQHEVGLTLSVKLTGTRYNKDQSGRGHHMGSQKEKRVLTSRKRPCLGKQSGDAPLPDL